MWRVARGIWTGMLQTGQELTFSCLSPLGGPAAPRPRALLSPEPEHRSHQSTVVVNVFPQAANDELATSEVTPPGIKRRPL